MRNSVFKNQKPDRKLNRTTYDLSFQNNGTYQFGKLYPVFCKPVIPGDSVRIKPTFGLKFMPMVFPVQSRMRAVINFFYVKNRNIWDKWQEFITGTSVAIGDPEPEMPYISQNSASQFFANRSLSDYLNIPTTQYSQKEINNYIDQTWQYLHIDNNDNGYVSNNEIKPSIRGEGDERPVYLYEVNPPTITYEGRTVRLGPATQYGGGINYINFPQTADGLKQVESLEITFGNGATLPADPFDILISTRIGSPVHATAYYYDSFPVIAEYTTRETDYKFLHFERITVYPSDLINGDTFVVRATDNAQRAKALGSIRGFVYIINEHSENVRYHATYLEEIGDMHIPFYSNSVVADDKKLRISALPYRVYESIYNAFYRNELVEPLLVDGKPNYTTWCPNLSSGADEYDYDFHYQNWEMDVYTSCYPTPQQGIAPLAGVSTNVGVNGEFTFTLNNDPRNTAAMTSYTFGNPSSGIGVRVTPSKDLAPFSAALSNIANSGSFTIRTVVTPTGDITGISSVDVDTPQEYVHYVKDIIRQGISINTLRNCNALQELLENTMRSGYRYRDNLKGMFGVDPGADTLQMPEYLGGVSQDVSVSTVVNQSPSDGENMSDVLGGYAGSANVFGDGRPISKYCDDYGYIMGILHITVEPCYTQTIPKDYLKTTRLDYYFDEFKNVGLQPLFSHELTPLQVAIDDDTAITRVFGYQRYGYDLLIAQDEAHGEFRNSLKNYLLRREFHSVPELSSDFLHIDPRQLNDVFSVITTDNDICQGQIWFDYSKKTIVPRFSIPRL